MNRGLWLIISIVTISTAALWFRQLYRQRLPEIPETIIIGTSADFSPFCFIENKEIVGFDIDIAKEVCRRLNKKFKIQNMPFEILIPQLQNGSIHFAAAGITATPERMQRAFFTTPYLAKDPLVALSLATEPKINTIDDLKNATLVVNQGYNADSFMTKLDIKNIIRLPSLNDALNALQTHKATVFVTSLNTLKPIFDLLGESTFSIFIINDANESTSLAVSPLYQKFGSRVDAIINQMINDGTIEKFKQKWHVQ